MWSGCDVSGIAPAKNAKQNKTKFLGCTKQGEIPGSLGDLDFYIHPISILSSLMKWYGFVSV